MGNSILKLMIFAVLLTGLPIVGAASAAAGDWAHVRIKYGPTEAPEDYCPDFRIDIRPDQSFWARGCGKEYRGRLTEQDFARLDEATRRVTERLDRELTCFNDGTADGPNHDFMIRLPGSGSSRTIYSRDDNGETCYRGDLESSEEYADLVESLWMRYEHSAVSPD